MKQLKLYKIGRLEIVCTNPKTNPYFQIIDKDGSIIADNITDIKTALLMALEHLELIKFYQKWHY